MHVGVDEATGERVAQTLTINSREDARHYKHILGDTLHAQTLTDQQTQTRVGCAVLNRMRGLAKPESYTPTKKA